MRYSKSEFTTPLRYLRTYLSISTFNAEFPNLDIQIEVYGEELDKGFRHPTFLSLSR